MHDRKSESGPQRPQQRLARAAFVLGLTLLTYLVCVLMPAPKAGGEAGVVMDLPSHIGQLYGNDEEVSKAELYILPQDTTFARKTYGDIGAPREKRILCSIVLSGAERRSIHRPERCLPSQGWRIDSSHTETIPLASGRDRGRAHSRAPPHPRGDADQTNAPRSSSARPRRRTPTRRRRE